MAGNPACERFIPQLSPYVDGELSPAERVHVERHLAACRDCTGRAADLRAESALLRVGLEMAVDEVDFKDFTQKVLARVTPERPPLLERVRISLSELFLYHRTAMVSSFVTAVLVALVAVPMLLSRNDVPMGYGGERMRVRAVRASEGAKVAPVVLESEDGNTIIWVVDDQEAQDGSEAVPGKKQDDAHDEDELDGEPGDKGSREQGGEL
jgi:anti-sigma factor RsiW